jgi:hypothetical protein
VLIVASAAAVTLAVSSAVGRGPGPAAHDAGVISLTAGEVDGQPTAISAGRRAITKR